MDDDGNPTGFLQPKKVRVKREAPQIVLVDYVNKRTGEQIQVPQGIDPGFEHPPARNRDLALNSDVQSFTVFYGVLDSAIEPSVDLPAPSIVDDSAGTHQWIHVAPIGPVVARDGRKFDFSDLLTIVALTELPLLVDYEHESAKDGSTIAAGWIEQLEIRDDGLWGLSHWTSEGLELTSDKSYRFLSPVVLVDRSTSAATKLLSVALTNTPALHLNPIDSTELFSQRGQLMSDTPELLVDARPPQLVALCAKLSLPEDSNLDAVLLAAEAVVERCNILQTELDASKKKIEQLAAESYNREIDQVLSEASKAGKVTPATAAKYREFCRKDKSNLSLLVDTILPTLPELCSKVQKPVLPDSGLPETPITEALKAQGLTDDQIKAALSYHDEVKSKRGLRAVQEE